MPGHGVLAELRGAAERDLLPICAPWDHGTWTCAEGDDLLVSKIGARPGKVVAQPGKWTQGL